MRAERRRRRRKGSRKGRSGDAERAFKGQVQGRRRRFIAETIASAEPAKARIRQHAKNRRYGRAAGAWVAGAVEFAGTGSMRLLDAVEDTAADTLDFGRRRGRK